MHRRDVVKFAAAVAVGTGMAAADSVRAGESSQQADAPDHSDDLLSQAMRYPQGFMLSEPEVITLDTDGHSRNLVITSARDEKGVPVTVKVPSRSVRIFRADPTVDEFTSQGGLYWRFRDKSGKVKLNKTSESNPFNQLPRFGPMVMVVRDEATVRVYTMTPDLRC